MSMFWGKRTTEMMESGTGYGGQKGDDKKFLAGRKKAERASAKDDNANSKFLKKILKNLNSKPKVKGCITSTSSKNQIDEGDRSKLSSVLTDIFRNQVPTDWDRRKLVYTDALDVSLALSSDESLGTIFGDKDCPESVLYWLLDFSRQANDILKRLQLMSESNWSKEDQGDFALATHVCKVSEAALKISRRCQTQKPVEELSIVTLSERYQSQLGPLRFDTVESLQNHYFGKHSATGLSTNSRLLFKELTAYRTALPVEYGSSCFCRVMSSQLNMLRVMITGPDETPYANGCFLFDIFLPSNYPHLAPSVHFLTTGGGKMRFNPNLYNCGKVCLSLLGTWTGPGWVSGQSTLLQVLISIQSLILVPDPFFNEPAYEIRRGTPDGDAQSKAYNKTIRSYTVAAAIESHLSAILGGNNPYVEFESAIIKHFLEKRSAIQKELWRWVKDDHKLAPTVGNICFLFEQLFDRERGAARAKKSRVSKNHEPIILDDDDDTKLPAVTKEMNSDRKIAIDRSDNVGASTKPKPVLGAGDFIDLTL